MSDYTYEIEIIQDKKLSYSKGKLILHWAEFDKNLNIPTFRSESLEFNILTILGDLRNQNIPYKYPYGRIYNDTPSNLSSLSYEYEYGFGKPIYVGDDENYLKFINKLKDILKSKHNKKITNIKIIEKLEKSYNMNLNCTIQVQKINPLTQIPHQRTKKISKYVYEDLYFEYGKANPMFMKNKYLEKEHKFIYKCFSLKEVILSIFHFLVIHSYTFKRCSLCQKDYVIGNHHGRSSGCSRISEYNIKFYLSGRQQKDYIDSKRTCQDTLKYLKDQNRYDKKIMTEHWRICHQAYAKQYTTYNNILKNFEDALNKNHCLINLRNIHLLVCKETRNALWYKKNATFDTELEKLKKQIEKHTFCKIDKE